MAKTIATKSIKSFPLIYANQTQYSFFHSDIFGSNNSSKNDKSQTPLEESAEEFQSRIFGFSTEKGGDGGGAIHQAFYKKLDVIQKSHGHSGQQGQMGNFGRGRSNYNYGGMGMDGGFDTLDDEMDDKLKKAATSSTFSQYNEEITHDDYTFRPDVTFMPGSTYTPRDLDLRRPGVPKSFKRNEFETTTKEVLKKADFRNVRFLANFITEAGIIIKRSQTKISAKAQRKVAREIKTARAFGLMPFTLMGTKGFTFGRSMEVVDKEYDEPYPDFIDVNDSL